MKNEPQTIGKRFGFWQPLSDQTEGFVEDNVLGILAQGRKKKEKFFKTVEKRFDFWQTISNKTEGYVEDNVFGF